MKLAATARRLAPTVLYCSIRAKCGPGGAGRPFGICSRTARHRLRSRVGRGPTLLKDPGVGHVGDLGEHGKIVSTEAVGRLPLVTVPVEAGQIDVVADAALRLVGPDRGLDGPETNLVDRPVLRVAPRHGAPPFVG